MEKKRLFDKINGLVHGGDYNPDQWLAYPEILKKDIELMKKAHVNCASLGIFSWAKYEPIEGNYDFEWLIKIMDDLYANGIYTILATPTGARPYWLDAKYPESKRCDEYGNREYHKERHNHCMSSEVFRELARDIDSRLAQRVKDHPGLIMWHLSNEYGGECYCDKCKNKFQKYLAKKFHNNIEELNHQYWTGFWSKHYNSFDEIEPPYKNGDDTLMGLVNDWHRFNSENAIDFMKMERDTVKKYTPDIPCTTNMMPFYTDYDYRKMAKELDVISWDSYPYFHNDYQSMYDCMQMAGITHAIMRSIKKDQPFMLMESAPSLTNWFPYNKLKRPGVHMLQGLQAIANGSDSVQYFQWRKSRGSAEQFHGAVVDHNGRSDTRVFKDVTALGEALAKLSEVAGTAVDASVAMIFDWENKWALQTTQAFQKNDKKYFETLYDFYGSLVSIAGDVDVIGVDDDFNRYKVIVAPMMLMVREGIGNKLKEFVKNGGQLLATYMLGYVNENQLAYLNGFPGDGLMELFGIFNEEIDTLYPSDRNGIITNDGKEVEVRDYCELIHAEGAEVLARYTQDFYKDYPAVTVNSYGLGKAYYVACRTDAKELKEYFIQMLKDGAVEYEEVPEHVEYHKRDHYYFYLNESEQMVQIENVKGENLLKDEMVEGKLALQPYEIAVIKK